MNPLLTIITLLSALRADLYTKFNAAMEKAKPLEQFEAGSAARGILAEIDWAKDRLERSGQELQATLENAGKFLSGFESKAGETPDMTAARFLEACAAKAAEDALAASIAEKKVISITDHENAITAAKEEAAETAKTTAEADFNSKLTAIKLVADRRADAVTRIGEIAAARITDEQLAADDFDAAITALEGRVNKLKEANITAEGRPKFYADLIAKPDEESFTASLELLLEAAGGKLAVIAAAAPTKPAGPGVSTAGAAPVSATTGEKKKTVI